MSVPSLRPVTTPAGLAVRRGSRPDRPKLGQILVDNGALSSVDQLRALALQGRVDARYGDILVAHGLIDKDRLYDTIARQYGTEHACFDTDPPDVDLIEELGVERCLSLGLLPWKRVRGITHIATARPERFYALRHELAGHFGPLRMVIASETDLHEAVLAKHPRVLVTKAETRVAADLSCRDWKSRGVSVLQVGLTLALLAGLFLAPQIMVIALSALAVLTLTANTGLKAAASVAQIRADQNKTRQVKNSSRPTISRLPCVSILVPLYREREIAHHLVRRLQKLTYPRELLDICLVVEADDTVTCDTHRGFAPAQPYPPDRGARQHAQDQTPRAELCARFLPWRHHRRLRRRGRARPATRSTASCSAFTNAAQRSPACRASSISTTRAPTGCRAALPSNTPPGSA